MISTKEGLLESLIEAFIMEKGTRDFYKKAAEAAHEEVAAKSFRELARWEEEHMGYLQYLYQSLTEDRELLSFEEFKQKVKSESVEGNIPLDVMKLKYEDYNFTDEIGALIPALEMEAKSYDYYYELSRKVEDTNVKALMKELMKFEEEHLKYLKKLRLEIEETS
jgi:rubrerythrin